MTTIQSLGITSSRYGAEKRGRWAVLILGRARNRDEIMFAGLSPEVVRTGFRCILACDELLVPLIASSFPQATIAADPGTLSEFSAQIPSGSLPGTFRRNAASFGMTVKEARSGRSA